MATWNSAYELSPQNFKNPGEGAFHFRDLKGAISERGVKEHFWGTDEDATKFWYGGVHKEGSAKATVTDGGSANRAAGRTGSASAAIGQLQIDLSKRGLNRTQNGDDLQAVAGYDYTAQLEKNLTVTGQQFDGTTGAWTDPTDPTVTEVFELFNYDNMMDVIQDQAVKGIKQFTHSPHVPSLAAAGSASVMEGWEDYLTTPPSTDGSGLSPVNITETYTAIVSARDRNIFDVTDDTNNIIASTDTVNNPISDTAETTSENISANIVFANKIYGAVYV